MRTITTLLIILLNLLVGDNSKDRKIEPIKISSITTTSVKATNLKGVALTLKNGNWTGADRDSLYVMTYKLFSTIIKRANKSYAISDEQLIRVIQTIALSESGTSKGYPFSNELFLHQNNPFGIQGGSKYHNTIEYIDGVRTPMELTFKEFSSLHKAINYLINTLWERERYKPLHKAATPLEFFKVMKECGYYTAPEYYNVFFAIYSKDKKFKH